MGVQVAFIGLGVMGFPMAGHLAEAGYQVTVYNRSPHRREEWLSRYQGDAAKTPAAAAGGVDFVFVCVGNDDDLRQVCLGEVGAFAGMKEGSVLVDHTTASAVMARELADTATNAGLGFLDAPVSGGQAGAENGALTVMIGGDAGTFEQAEPVIQHYARCVQRMGEAGAGQLAKMVNQICIGGLVQGLSEGLHFARKVGLDPAKVVEVISQGAAQSWQMENRYQTMLQGEYNHGFAVDWMRKDLSICLDEARKKGVSLPVTAMVDQLYAQVQAMGGGRWDTSSLLALLESVGERAKSSARDSTSYSE